MSSGMINQVAMIILMEQDLAKAVEFYQKLGFELKFHLKDKWAEFELNNVKFGLCPTSEEPALVRTGIVLEVKDLRAIYEQNKNWIEFFGEPHEAVHGIMISFKDPSGNVLDLYQPTPEKVQELMRKTAEQGGEGEDCCGSQDSCC